jgi:hypothetical protein
VESDFIIGNEATAVGSAAIFTPGIFGTGGTSVSSVSTPTTVVANDTSTIVWNNLATAQPGNALSTAVAGVRAVAACVTVTFAGTEQNRGGFVTLQQTTHDHAYTLNTLAKIRASADVVERVPAGNSELRMEPSSASAEFSFCNAQFQDNRGNLPALVVSASGIPVSTGIRVRFTVVWEWIPTSSAGLGTMRPGPSETSVTSLLRWLERVYPNWQYDVGSVAGRGLAMLV